MNNLELPFVLAGGILFLDKSLKILEVSSEFCQEFSCNPETLIGEKLENIFSRKDRKGKLAFHHHFRSEINNFLDLTITISINNQEFMTRLRMVKQKDKWLANLENIFTDHEDLFSQLYIRRERWSNVIRNSSEGIAILDIDGNLVEFNSNFLKIMEFSSVHGVMLNEEAIINKNIFTLFNHECCEELENYFNLAKTKHKRKFRQEIEYKKYCLQLELTPIRLPVQGFIGCSLVVKDVTAQKQLEQQKQELEAAQQQIMALNEQLQAENIRMSAELDILRRIQELVLPKPEELEAIKGLEIAGYMQPADEVGGDYYDVLCHEGIVTIGIGDVTGHGLESGLLMVMTQTAVRILKEIREVDPVIFLDTLNKTIYKNIQRMNTNKNLTLAVLNYADGKFSLSGQHEETIIVRQGGIIERIDTIDLGFPIGLDYAIADFINQTSVQLYPGEILALYTDGITEAENINGEFYGVERLCKILSENWQYSAKTIKNAVIDDVKKYIGQQKIYDDITLVILKQK